MMLKQRKKKDKIYQEYLVEIQNKREEVTFHLKIFEQPFFF